MKIKDIVKCGGIFGESFIRPLAGGTKVTKTEALQQRKEMLKLIEQWTRAEIMARYARFDNNEFTNYATIQIEMEDKLRDLVFGTDNLVALGVRWGLL